MAALAAAGPVSGPVSGPRADIAAFVEDDESRRFLEGYLRDAASGAHVARGGVEAAARWLEAAAAPPRVLIVDLSGSEIPLSAVDRLAEVCEPSIVVIAVGAAENVHLFRELIRAGVADYVTKPLTGDLLDPYVRDRRDKIAAASGPARRGRLVAFAGARGGVGATTLAVAAAAALSTAQKRRVALVDLDLHGGAACIQLGLQPGGLIEALGNHRRLDALYLERTLIRHGPRLSVLADEAPLKREAALEPEALDALFAALAEEFHYVVVDLPCRFGPAHAHVLKAARTRVIVADRTLPALRDAARLIDLARETPEPLLLALNDHHPGLAGLIADAQVTEALGRRPDLTIAYDRGAASRADNLGESLAEGRGPIAEATRRLVGGLAGRGGAPKRRWFGLFGGGR